MYIYNIAASIFFLHVAYPFLVNTKGIHMSINY